MLRNKVFRGFTLIELLVVISIMVILIGLSVFGLQQARESARDGQRKSDLETIRTGLSFYRADCNFYPTPASGTGGDFKTKFGSSFNGNCITPTPNYIEKVPSDPLVGRSYYYTSDGTIYNICSSLETETGPTPVQCTGATCGSGVNCNYYVANP